MYPKPEYCGTFKVLKPIKYKIIELREFRRFTNRREQFIEVDQIDTLKYDNTFPADYLCQKLSMNIKKYNL